MSPDVRPRYAVPASRGQEAPVMAEPGEESGSEAGGRDRLRASRADRERVIELLKVAFVQERLTQDELDTRVGLALASRTYADLAVLTADLPAGSAAAEPAVKPGSTPARTLAKAVGRAGLCMLVVFALVGIAALTNSPNVLGLAVCVGIFAVVAASGFLGYGVVDAWQERRSRGSLPPRPRRNGSGLEGRRPGTTDRDPALPGTRPDQTRAEARALGSRPGRPRSSGRKARAPRGRRLVPDAG
jgi:Domain of unknown function (DUF1707)